MGPPTLSSGAAASDAFLTLIHRTPVTALAGHAAISAVIAGYPLLESLRTCRVQTGGAEALPAGATGYGRAPFNRLGHSAQRWTDRDRDIVTPANDLLYSNAWLDLRSGPVVIEVAQLTGRYFVLELLDVYTNNFHNIGPRNCLAAGGRFALMAPDANGEPPPGCTAIRCPTDLVWLLGRVLVDDDADLAPARAFQAGFQLQAPPAAALPTSIAAWQEGGDPALDFLANLLRAVRDFPPPDSQRGALVLLGSIHVRLDADGRLADLRPGVVEGLRQGFAAGMQLIEAFTRSASKAPWRYSTRLGRYGDDLMLRAATAFKGLGALAADEAIYVSVDYDSDGRPLDGAHRYRLHFADGGQLPADAFWSITLYGADRYLAANALNRHALGNRSPLERAADGSLALEMSHRTPRGPQQNWLPAPDGSFYLILRLYHPQQRFLEGRYRFPEVERVE
jgi:hypothetical protein